MDYLGQVTKYNHFLNQKEYKEQLFITAFNYVSKTKDKQLLDKLFKLGLKLYYSGFNNLIKDQNIDKIKLILDLCKDLNLLKADKNKLTPLHYALNSNNKYIANLLVDYLDQVISLLNQKEYKEQLFTTAFNYVSKTKDKELLNKLINLGLKPIEIDLINLIKDQSIYKIKLILDINKSINLLKPNKDKLTPLHYALNSNNKDIANLLVDYLGQVTKYNHLLNQQIEYKEQLFVVALNYVSKTKDKQLLDKLFKLGLKLDDSDLNNYINGSEFNNLIKDQNIDKINLILDLYKDLNLLKPDKDKLTPLHYALNSNNKEIASLLVDYLGQVTKYNHLLNQQIKYKEHLFVAALNYVSKTKDKQLLDKLFKLGLKLNNSDFNSYIKDQNIDKIKLILDLYKDLNLLKPDKDKLIPLHYALNSNNKEIANLLVDYLSANKISLINNYFKESIYDLAKEYVSETNDKELLVKLSNLGVNTVGKRELDCLDEINNYIKDQNIDKIKLILDKNKDLNLLKPNKDKLTPLHYALNSNNKDMVNLLVNYLLEKKIKLRNYFKESIYNLAKEYVSETKDKELLDKLINLGLKQEIILDKIYNLIKDQSIDKIKLILDKNKDLNLLKPNKFGLTPLHYALNSDSKHIANLLVDYLGQVTIYNNLLNQKEYKEQLFITAFNYVSKTKDKALLNKLINLGLKPIKIDLINLIKNQSIYKIKVILDINKSISLLKPNKFGLTPLHYALNSNNNDIANLLVDCLGKASKNNLNKKEYKEQLFITAFNYVSKTKDKELLNKLINLGLKPIKIDLINLIKNQSIYKIKLILDINKSISLLKPNKFGLTPLDYALSSNNKSVVNLILDKVELYDLSLKQLNEVLKLNKFSISLQADLLKLIELKRDLIFEHENAKEYIFQIINFFISINLSKSDLVQTFINKLEEYQEKIDVGQAFKVLRQLAILDIKNKDDFIQNLLLKIKSHKKYYDVTIDLDEISEERLLDLKQQKIKSLLNAKVIDVNDLLFRAIKIDNLELLELAINNGANLLLANKSGLSALHFILKANNKYIVNVIINKLDSDDDFGKRLSIVNEEQYNYPISIELLNYALNVDHEVSKKLYSKIYSNKKSDTNDVLSVIHIAEYIKSLKYKDLSLKELMKIIKEISYVEKADIIVSHTLIDLWEKQMNNRLNELENNLNYILDIFNCYINLSIKDSSFIKSILDVLKPKIKKLNKKALISLIWNLAVLDLDTSDIISNCYMKIHSDLLDIDNVLLHKYLTAMEYYKQKYNLIHSCKDIPLAKNKIKKQSRVSTSKMQNQVVKYLNQNRIDVEEEYWIDNIVNNVDMAIPYKKIAIEFDGPVHFCKILKDNNVVTTKEYDLKSLFKTKLLENSGWKVIRIPYFKWKSRKFKKNIIKKIEMA